MNQRKRKVEVSSFSRSFHIIFRLIVLEKCFWSLNQDIWSLSALCSVRPVSSMLTFPLMYDFLPLSMRITSWIVKKKKVSLCWKKVVRKKVELQATCFVFLVRSLINLWFLTNQIEETNKQIKLRWREVDQSLMAMLSVWKTV